MKTWTCPAGSFQGFESQTCHQLRGIRYGTSERFCEPRPYRYPVGIHSCLDKSPYAIQLPSAVEEYLFGVDYTKTVQEESCQYLSITIPKRSPREGHMPVMVWIHGGAFRNGGCDHDCYDSDLLADEGGVIVVRVNYRLGVLGYVKNREGQAANLGLMDVIEALRWIQENIASFGGNPENVTVFGQSAGAQTVAAILVAEGTDNLFRSAIMQSAPLGAMSDRQAMERKILDELNEMPLDASLDEVRQTQAAILEHVTETGAAKAMPFAPHYGAAPLPEADSIQEILKERASRHPLLIGCNAREVSAYIGSHKVVATLDRLPLTRRIIENALEKKGDEIFASPSRAFARQYAMAGGQCGFYDYYWTQNKAVIGACHCHELVPLFGGKSLEGLDIMMGLSEDDVRKAGKQIRQVWTEFARTGMIQSTQIDDMLTLTRQ